MDFANPYETCDCMYGTHIAPPSLERRNRTESDVCQNHTQIAPRRSRIALGVRKRASGALQRTQEQD